MSVSSPSMLVSRLSHVASYSLLIALVASCSGAERGLTSPDTPGVSGVIVSPSATSLTVGATIALTAQLRDASGNVVPATGVFWSSNDTTVATVSSVGVVTARDTGMAQIAASAGGQSAIGTITVTPVPVASVAIVPGSGTVSIGATMGLTAVTYDANGASLSGRPVVWGTSAPQVATVSATGVVTGIAAGTAQITGTSEGKSGAATITVTLVPVAKLSVTPASLALTTGQAASLTVQAFDASGNALQGRGVTWSSDNSAAATVAGSGLVTAVAPGNASITATSEGISVSVPVVVSAPPPAPPPAPAAVAALSISPSSISINVGGGAALSATPTDSHGNVLTGRTVTWLSSAPQTASVDGSGNVTGVAAGTATITASCEGKTATAQITVNTPPPPPPAAVASVTVAPTTVTLIVGSTANLSAATRDASGNLLGGRTITWTSGTPGIATVSSSGVVTAVATGTAVITATSGSASGSAQITVNPLPPAPVASVTVTPSTATLTPGGSVSLTATTLDSAQHQLTGRSVTWLSSAPAVATVSSSGTVTAVATGSATITAMSEGKSGTAQITVNAPPPAPVATVTVSPSTMALLVGATATASAETKDASGNVLPGRVVTWSSSAPAVASVSAQGLVTALGAGAATITATSEGKIGTAQVTVSVPPVASVAITPATLSLAVGATGNESAVTKIAGGVVVTGRTIVWSSKNTQIATVDAQGVVTAVAVGTDTLTATSEGITGTSIVTVTVAPVASIVVTPASLTLAERASTTASVTLYDANHHVLTGRVITWSATPGPVTVTVTPLTASSATITAGTHPGSLTLTVMSEGQSTTVPVTITPH